MHPKRKQRLYLVGFLLLAAGGTTAALMAAFQENVNLFFEPEKIVNGMAPIDTTIRAGGMVVDGSVQRDPSSLDVQFTLTDHQGSNFVVRYSGILPDLFREGQGILVKGQLQQSGEFAAVEVLAKHDENYMPPELLDMTNKSKQKAAARVGEGDKTAAIAEWARDKPSANNASSSDVTLNNASSNKTSSNNSSTFNSSTYKAPSYKAIDPAVDAAGS